LFVKIVSVNNTYSTINWGNKLDQLILSN